MKSRTMDDDNNLLFPMDELMEQDHNVNNNANLDENYYPQLDYPLLADADYQDWQYVLRRSMQEIIPGIFLGPYAAATRAKIDDMRAAGLTHVVCVRGLQERNLIRANHVEYFNYLIVEIADVDSENIISHFGTVNTFLDECLASGGKALVHGNGGNSRSSALVIAYVMWKYGVSDQRAFKFVRAKRLCICPNLGFMAQLKEYEPIYRAKHTVALPLPTENRASVKRYLEPENDENTG